MKRAIYWFTIKPLEGEEEGTDRWAFGKNLVSITPLRLDLTDEKDLARVLALTTGPAQTARRKAPAKSTK
jgi:5'-nucleotidase